MRSTSLCLTAALALMPFGPALAQSVVAGTSGMTLYTFDKDSGGASACYEDCAKNWPPFTAESGTSLGEGWTMIDRSDGTKQWAYDGKPTYYFAGDKKAGETSGDGKGGIWHVLKK